MKKDTEKKEPEKKEFTGYQDEFAGQGGSYIYDPLTKKRTPHTPKDDK